jgi:hypothetical protein
VTPIFSTSYSGLFKSFIDVLDPDALTGMPVLIGANAGTARHSLAIDYAIRPLFAYLHADAVSTGVFAASSDWGGAADQVAPLSARVEKGARELAEAVARRTGDRRRPVRPGELSGQLPAADRRRQRVWRRTPAGRARGRIVARSRSARGERRERTRSAKTAKGAPASCAGVPSASGCHCTAMIGSSACSTASMTPSAATAVAVRPAPSSRMAWWCPDATAISSASTSPRSREAGATSTGCHVHSSSPQPSSPWCA